MRLRGARPGDPYFVWLSVVVLAAFGLGLTNPHRTIPSDTAGIEIAPEMIPAAYVPDVVAPAPRSVEFPGALAMPAEPRRAPAALAIVIDDLGGSPEVSARAAALPRGMTLSFLPLGPDVAAQASDARARGHEVLLHLPMEAIDEDAGPGALAMSDTAATIAAKLRSGLALVPNAVGLNNHMGSRFTADASAASRLAQALRGLDLIFLDSRTSSASLAARFARGAGLSVAERDIFIDHDGATAEDVGKALLNAEIAARRTGSKVLIAHPYRSTLSALEIWTARIGAGEVELITLSEHVRRKAASSGGRIASLTRVPASAY